jgi:tetratricopeptide (TPR) repeat protein
VNSSAKSSPTPPRRNSVWLLLVAFVLLAAAGWTWHRASRFWWAESQFDAAKAALEQEDFQAANDHLHQYLTVRPDNPDAYYYLGRIARQTDQEAEAMQYYQQCEEHGGDKDVVELERSLLRAQKGKLADVENWLSAFAEKEPTLSPVVLEALVRGCLRTYRLNSAIKYLDRWLEKDKSQARALLWKGEALILLKRPTEAIDTLSKLDNEEGRLALGKVLADASRAGEALKQFDRVLKEHPTSPLPQAVLGRAECLLALNRASEAGKALDALSADELELPRALLLRGKVELARDQPAAAEPLLRQAVKASPHDREPLSNLALCLDKLHQRIEPDTLRDKVKRIDRDREQLDALTRKIIQAPTNAALRCQAGELCLKSGNDKEGIRWLESALLEDPLNRQAHSLLAAYYHAHDQPELAARHGHQPAKKP